MKCGEIKLYQYIPLFLFPQGAERIKIDLETANKVEEMAKKLTQEYYQRNPCDARAPSTIGYAALYASCMLNGFYLTLADISRVTGKNTRSIKEAYEAMRKTLGLKER